MANRTPNFASTQPDLFQQLEQPALDTHTGHDLDIGPELLGALNQAIRGARRRGLSRERIVERMTLALPEHERPVTLRQLNAWTAQSKEYHEFPARYLPAFCWAADSVAPLLVLAQAIGHDLADGREKAAQALGERLLHKARLSREIHDLTKTLEG